ncbi:hypothetical protein NDU88_006027 [Pleurodeles waltl]|uniref:Uncharacterized protein n=1 Tax=Pleurodeles waltl TaxID=8319 RepID=A0AAV7RNS1_PLEWA|nr:hypothetical protein NDU88_006027 [Pleurodeles waltl]
MTRRRERRLRTAVASHLPSPLPLGSRRACTPPHRRSCTTPQHHSAGSLLALVIAPKGLRQPPYFFCAAPEPSHLRHTSSLPPGPHPRIQLRCLCDPLSGP